MSEEDDRLASFTGQEDLGEISGDQTLQLKILIKTGCF